MYSFLGQTVDVVANEILPFCAGHQSFSSFRLIPYRCQWSIRQVDYRYHGVGIRYPIKMCPEQAEHHCWSDWPVPSGQDLWPGQRQQTRAIQGHRVPIVA
jgi:hypothetical protein